MKRSPIQKQFTKFFVLIAILALSSSPVLEAESSEMKVYEEEEVVITATRTSQQASQAPGRTEVITKEAIEKSGTTTIAEVLANQGITISTYGGASGTATVQLDGAEPKQTLVLINGIPVNGGTGGNVDLSCFPVAGVQRIEVTHGPLSALYGANALGGVVNIITDLTGTAMNKVNITSGSNEYGQFDLAWQQPKFGLALGGRATEGFRKRSETKTGYLMGQYDFLQGEESELRLNFLYNIKDYESPGSITSIDIEDGVHKNTAVDLTGKTHFDQIVLEYKIFSQHYKLEYNSFNPSYNFKTKDCYRSTVWGSDIAASYLLGMHQLLAGVQLKKEQLSSYKVIDEYSWQNGALFLQDNWQISSLWQLVSGVRWDTGTAYSSPLCPRIGLNYAMTEQFTLKFGYGKAFRAPTFDDLYYPESSYTDTNGVTSYLRGNSDLKPETSQRYEITGEWRSKAQSISVNYFATKVVDGIDWRFVNNVYAPINIDKMQINGGSVNWKQQWNQYFFTELKASRTDRQAWDSATDSYSIDKNYFGKNRYTIHLGHNHGAWSSILDWNYVTNRNENMPDYHTVDFTVKYQLNHKLTYGLTINNLTDNEYQIHAGYPMPGREYYLSAKYTF